MDSYQDWVQADFVVAVLLTVLIPLLLLFFSLKHSPLLGRLLAYWRVSALLAITVYLLMAEISLGLLTGVIARVLIPPVLWMGDGLMQSTKPLPQTNTSIYRGFVVWRVLLTLYCIVGVIFTLPLLSCGLTGNITATCAAWYVPPQMFGALLHDPKNWETLGEIAMITLLLYGMYLLLAIYRLAAVRRA